MFWNDTDIINAKTDIMNAKIDKIMALLTKLVAKETTMAIDLTKLTAEVAANASVEASVVTLLGQLTAIIRNIPPSADPTTQAALDELTSTLAANDTALAGAVVANTLPASASQSGTQAGA